MAALGSLVVSMALEYANYTAGLDKSEQAALKMAKNVQDTMDGLKRTLAVTAGAIAGGLAAGFTINAFKNLIAGTIESNAALEDLATQTGSTVEALTGLAAVGKFSDQSAQSIADAMGKLTKNLAGATEESKGAGKALEALGINFDTFKRMSPDEQMVAVAKAMDKFGDGSGKAAVAMALYGKEGAKMLPFMKDLAVAGDLQAKVTTKQSAASANFDDNMLRLQVSGDAWKKELAQGIIPALDSGLQAVLDMGNGTGGLRDEIKRLVADGTITQWALRAIRSLSYLVDIGQVVMGVLRGLGKVAGAQLAITGQVFGAIYEAFVKIQNADFSGAFGSLKAGVAGVSSVAGSLKDDLVGIMDEKLLGARFRDQMDANAAKVKAVGDAAQESKRKMDFTNVLDKNGKSAAAAADSFAKLLESVTARTAAYSAEFDAGQKLSEGQKVALGLMEKLRLGSLKLGEADTIRLAVALEEMLTAESLNEARTEELKQLESLRAASIKEVETAEKNVASMAEQNQALREEIELIGLSEAGQLRVAQARNAATIAVKEATLAELERQSAITGTMSRAEIALREEIDLLRERNGLLGIKVDKTAVAKAAETAASEWTKFNDDIRQGLTDSLFRGFEAGKGFFKSFWDGIKNLFKTTVLKLAVQGVMTGVTGMASGAANAAGGGSGGIGGLLSNANSIYSAVTGGLTSSIAGAIGSAGSMFGSSALTSFAAGMKGSTLAAGLAGPTTVGAGGAMGMGASFGSFAAAAGPWALAAAAVYGLVKKFDTSGTPHVGQLAQYSAAGGLATSQTHGAFGMGFGGVGYNEGAATLVQGVSQTIVGILDSTATAFGKAAGYSVATGFADDSSKDGAWGGLLVKQMGNVVTNWDTSRSSKWAPREFADGEAGQKQYLAALAADTASVLKGMNLGGWANDILNALGASPSLESLATAVDQINVTKAALNQMGAALTGFASMSDGAISALIRASGGIEALAANASSYRDNFYSEAEKQATASKQVADAMARVNLQMPTTRDGYRALVEQYTAMGEAGSQQLAVLLALNTAFAAAVPAAAGVESLATVLDKLRNPVRSIEDIARNIISLEDELFALQNEGNTAALRARALAGLSDTERAIQLQIYALQDQRDVLQQVTDAAQAAADAQAKNIISLEDELFALQNEGNTAALRARALAGLSDTERAIQLQIYALQDQRDVLQQVTDAAQAAADAQAEYINSLARAGGGIASLIRELTTTQGGSADAMTVMRQTQANYLKDLALAREGDVSASERIAQSARDYIDASGAVSASATQAAINAQVVSELKALPATRTYEQKMLDELVKITDLTAQQLSAQNIANTLLTNFGAFDINLDGLLTFEELKIALQGKASDAELRAMFQMMDANGDGTISQLELVRNNTAAQVAHAAQQLNAQNIANTLLTNFGAFDINLDGLLTFEELKIALQGKASDAELRAMFQMMDANGDGTISQLELVRNNTAAQVAHAAQQLNAQNIANTLLTNFGALDINLDGLLTFEELKIALQGKASDAELRAMFQMMDANGDGTISQLELVRNNTLAGAQAAQTLNAQYIGQSLALLNRLSENANVQNNFTSQMVNQLNTSAWAQLQSNTLLAGLLRVTATSSEKIERLFNYNFKKSIFDIQAAIYQTLGGTAPTQPSLLTQSEWDAYFAGTQRFAQGGVFTNSIVDRATNFSMGQMGEAGPEAIMPLERGPGGDLGVRMYGRGPYASLNFGDMAGALATMATQLAKVSAELAEIKRGVHATAAHTADTKDGVRTLNRDGLQVWNDPKEPLSTKTEAVVEA